MRGYLSHIRVAYLHAVALSQAFYVFPKQTLARFRHSSYTATVCMFGIDNACSCAVLRHCKTVGWPFGTPKNPPGPSRDHEDHPTPKGPRAAGTLGSTRTHSGSLKEYNVKSGPICRHFAFWSERRGLQTWG